jgi:predicted nucleotide-binding protein
MTRLSERFDRAGIIDALMRQPLIRREKALAEKFADVGRPKELEVGELLVEQGDWASDLYFVLAGEFDAIIHGQTKQTRVAGEAVGELAGLSPSRPRTATLKATKASFVLAVSYSDLQEIVGSDVDFWKAAADAVADQLDHRNREIGAVNEHPKIFVISSKEGIEVAREVRKNLDGDDMQVHLWDHDTFMISDYPISSLEDAIERCDFTIAVAQADDVLITREETHKVPRDNVHFEYGISVGRLGRDRSFLLVRADTKVKLASDLAGLTTLRYQGDEKDKMKRTVAKACDVARERIDFIGVRRDRRAC